MSKHEDNVCIKIQQRAEVGKKKYGRDFAQMMRDLNE